MATILNASIDLTKIPKDAIYVGKKGKYANISITINDELDQFGNQGPITTLSQLLKTMHNPEDFNKHLQQKR
jgi:hypothetical protein